MCRFILLNCFLFILFSCKSGEQEIAIPTHILKQDKVVSVLIDIHLEEAKLQTLNLGRSPIGVDTISFTDVFKRNNITKAEFDSSMAFYTSNPTLMNETYDKVIEQLSNRKEEAEKGKHR